MEAGTDAGGTAVRGSRDHGRNPANRGACIMTLLPKGVKVHLAFGLIDMRNYAERTVMPSPRRQEAVGRGHLVDLTPHNLPCAPPCSAWPRACRVRGSGRASASAAPSRRALPASRS